MTISRDQASEALTDIARTETRSRELQTYRESSPHLFLWGAIWALGYGVTGLSPLYGYLIWLPLSIVGGITAGIIGKRTNSDPRVGRRIGLSIPVAIAFAAATYAIMRPQDGNQLGAFPALLMAGAYCIAGIWGRPRFLWLGIALFVLTLGGFFYLSQWFSYWMAVVGAGALILGGVWLRKV